MPLISLEDFLCKDKIGEGQNPVFRVIHRLSGKQYALKRIKRKHHDEHISDLQEITVLTKL